MCCVLLLFTCHSFTPKEPEFPGVELDSPTSATSGAERTLLSSLGSLNQLSIQCLTKMLGMLGLVHLM
jgi:hypothetical protein